MWVGFAHKSFRPPHDGVQLQFGIDREEVWCNGIWIQHDARARKEAWRQLWINFDKFLKALKTLPKGYVLELWHPHADGPYKRWSARADRVALEDFLHTMGDEDAHVHLRLPLPRREAIQLQEDLPVNVARNFDKLLPLYSLMINQSPRREEPGPPPARKEEDLLYEVRNAIRKGKGRSQGFRISPEKRMAIENHAMEEATRHFRSQGYRIRNVSSKQPFDLLCRKRRELHVEVKGTSTAGEKILLTRNEVAHARNRRHRMALFVLREVRTAEKRGRVIAHSGKQSVKVPWHIDETLLEPLGFEYQLGRERKDRGRVPRR